MKILDLLLARFFAVLSRLFFFILAVSLCAGLPGCTERKRLDEVKKYTQKNFPGSQILFALEDPRYDDRGPGNYLYPYSDFYRKGMFDLTGFLVYTTGNNVVFEIEMDTEIASIRQDGTSDSNNFVLHNLDIYIDTDRVHGSGNTRTLPGRNVEIYPASAWEKMILVTPENARSVERQILAQSNDLSFQALRSNIIVADDVDVRKNKFVIRVPKAKLGAEPDRNWGYQVLVSLYENVQGPDNFKVAFVRPIPDETHFGGGSTFPGAPNVIDVLLPEKISQARLLADFQTSGVPEKRNNARVPCVYARRSQSEENPDGRN